MKGEYLLKAENITKNFPGVKALDDVRFDLKKGEAHALLGENGAGKSTLIKILGGIYRQDKGQVYFEGQPVDIRNAADAIALGISTIHQELNLAENMTIAENVYFGRMPKARGGFVDRKKLEADAKGILRRIGLNTDVRSKVRFLSIAQKQMLEIGKSLSKNAKVIIMDEPTSSLSPEEIQLLFRIIRELKAGGVSVIYISHKLDEIFEICDRVTVLRDGNYIDTLDVGDTDDEHLINLMVGRETRLDYKRESANRGDILFEIRGLTTDSVKDASFEVRKGEIVGFSGLLGAGKSEMARALFGLDEIKSGTILLDGRPIDSVMPYKVKKLGIGYLPEDRKADGLFLNQSVGVNMSMSSVEQFVNGIIVSRELEREKEDEQIERLKIKTPSLRQKMRNLSGGNQQKTIIARWLMREGVKLLIIDEPTRGIDVGAKYEIYNIMHELAIHGVSLLVMSSEIEELLKVSDRIVVLRDGRITAILSGEDKNPTEIMKYSVN